MISHSDEPSGRFAVAVRCNTPLVLRFSPPSPSPPLPCQYIVFVQSWTDKGCHCSIPLILISYFWSTSVWCEPRRGEMVSKHEGNKIHVRLYYPNATNDHVVHKKKHPPPCPIPTSDEHHTNVLVQVLTMNRTPYSMKHCVIICSRQYRPGISLVRKGVLACAKQSLHLPIKCIYSWQQTASHIIEMMG